MELMKELLDIVVKYNIDSEYDHHTLEFIESVKNNLKNIVNENMAFPELTSIKPSSMQIGKNVCIEKLSEYLCKQAIPFMIKPSTMNKPSELLIYRFNLMAILTELTKRKNNGTNIINF